MIANGITTLLGLWLAYSAIFASSVGRSNDIALAVTSVVVVALAFVSLRTSAGRWQAATNIVLGILLLLLAIARRFFTLSPHFSFWTIMLAGITISILALWAALYRLLPGAPADAASPMPPASSAAARK
jgi:hypothetical protein